jgi:RHS repeat-associated protein
VNSSQTKAASYRYDPFGNTISSSGTLASGNVYRFSSKEIHVNSGLYYYGYRWYAPSLQRWLNRDPIGEDGGINLYSLVLNDPIDLFDPNGESIFKGFKAWRCRRAMDKWYKKCVKDIPPCTRGVGVGARGPCPYDQPSQDPEDHWLKCEVDRVEKIGECAKKAQEMFDKCMGLTNPVPGPRLAK